MSAASEPFTAAAIPPAPPDSHYGTRAIFRADKHPDKVDVTIGAYRDDNGRPWVLPVVRKAWLQLCTGGWASQLILERLGRKKAEEIYHANRDRNNEYLPIPGVPEFTEGAQKLVLGESSEAIQDGRVCSFQTISGTGAVHLGALLLSKFREKFSPNVYVSDPTWDNHVRLFENVGLSVNKYTYLGMEQSSLDIEGLLSSLASAPPGSVVVLQPCAHNPTGLDPSRDDWKRIAKIVNEAGLFPFFDCAYQGFATGSLAEDSFPIRYFVEQGMEMMVAQSFSKNLGMYGHRVGCLHYIVGPGVGSSEACLAVASQLSVLQRSEISTPPIYGAKIASIILGDRELFAEWERTLPVMAGRITDMRQALRQELESLGTPGTWSHITSQIGMFSYTGLGEEQVVQLREKWHIYMLLDGRVSISGLNWRNIKYFARAVDAVVRSS